MEDPSGREVGRHNEKQKLEDQERDTNSCKTQGFQTQSHQKSIFYSGSVYPL